MIIAPVIFLTVVSGIAGMTNLEKVGRVGGKALIYFITFSTLALIVGHIDMRELANAASQRGDQSPAWRSDIDAVLEFPEHRLQPLGHFLGNAVEQKRRRALLQGTRLPRAQQSTVEQNGRCGRVRSHGGLVRRSTGLWQRA